MEEPEPAVLWEAGDAKVLGVEGRLLFYAKGSWYDEDGEFIVWPADQAYISALKQCISDVLDGKVPENPQYKPDGIAPRFQSIREVKGEITTLEILFGVLEEELEPEEAEGAEDEVEYVLQHTERFEKDYRQSVETLTRAQIDDLIQTLG